MPIGPLIPHFAAPFAFNPDGSASVVDQDTPQEITACVYNICSCVEGARVDAPDFGVPDVSFSTMPVDMGGVLTDLVEQEPRARLSVRYLDAAEKSVTGPRQAGESQPGVSLTPGSLTIALQLNAPGTAVIAIDVEARTS